MNYSYLPHCIYKLFGVRFEIMSQDIIYDISDSDDEDKQWKVNDVSIEGVLDPELMSYVDHIPSIKVEEDDILEVVNRYNGIDWDRHIKSEVLSDIYADPSPSSSHQNINSPKVNDVSIEGVLDPELMSYVDRIPSIKVEEDDILEVVNRYNGIDWDRHIKSEVLSDIYADPNPSSSHQNINSPKEDDILEVENRCNGTVWDRHIKSEVLSDIYADPTPSSSHQNINSPKEDDILKVENRCNGIVWDRHIKSEEDDILEVENRCNGTVWDRHIKSEVNDVSIEGVLDPELMSYVDRIPSIKVEEDDILEVVNRYNGIDWDRHIKSEVLSDINADPSPSSSHQNINSPKEDDILEGENRWNGIVWDRHIKREVLCDIYADPTPSSSHQNINSPKEDDILEVENRCNGTVWDRHIKSEVLSDIYADPTPSSSHQNINSPKEDDILEVENRCNGTVWDRHIKSEVLSDIYADPTPSSSHQNINSPKVLSDIYADPTPSSSHQNINSPKEDDILEVENRCNGTVWDRHIKSEVLSDIYADPTPSSSHQNINSPKEDDILEVENRCNGTVWDRHIKSEVLSDIYADPTPSSSHQNINSPKEDDILEVENRCNGTVWDRHIKSEVLSDIYADPTPSSSHQNINSPKEDDILEVENRCNGTVWDRHIKSEVLSDIYADPTPSSSHQNINSPKVLSDIYADPTPSSSHQNINSPKVLSDIYADPTPSSSHQNINSPKVLPDIYADPTPSSSHQNINSPKVLSDIYADPTPSSSHQNINSPKVSKDIYDNPTPGCSYHYVDTQDMKPSNKAPVMQSNVNDTSSNNNSVPKNEIESSVYKESLQSLSLLYHQINGLHNTGIDVDQESLIKFCLKIGKIKSNHRLILSEVEKGNLIKFEQLVIWGRNLHRNAEELIKEGKPEGSYLEEAEKFVLKTMGIEIRYRQNMAANNERYAFVETEHYNFNCIACDRRDNNLTWLVAHLCRDTAEIIYMCSFCGFLFFNNICSLLYHVVLDLIKEPKVEYCIECGRFFPSVANHLMDMEGSWKVCCDTCDFISLSPCSLLIHQRFHKKEMYHACPECGAYFVFFYSLEEHLKNVCYFWFKKIRHICPACGIIFKDKDTLYQHLFGFHHQRWIKCIQCPTLLINRFQYIKHRAQNHPESPCTYQMCHTCTLCPGQHFKIAAAQLHMKNHADDVKNIIVLYICDCNYYTIHKHNFIEHKAQNCEASPTFGKWVNNHEMCVCSSCNELKFSNHSKPFVCENCEVSSESRISSLIETYECKVCGSFLIYNWEAVIEHFFTSHPSISICKYPNYLRSTYISRSCDQTMPTQHSNNIKIQTDSVELCEVPIKMHKIDENSRAVVNSNIANIQDIRRKKTPKKKGKAIDVSCYDSLSHFMAPNFPSLSNQVKMKIQKNIIDINTNPSPSPCGNDVSITRLEQSVSILANSKNTIQDSLSVDSKNSSMLCASSVEIEKNGPINSSGNFVSDKKSIITVLLHPNHPDKTNNQIESKSTISSTEDFIKMEAEMDITTKKSLLECKKCQFKCNETIELVKHFSDSHFIQNTYQCMECGECFANLKNKLNHLRSTHKIDTKCYLEPDVNRLDSCRSEFRCPVCLRGFLCNQDKNMHMRSHGLAYLQSIKRPVKEM